MNEAEQSAKAGADVLVRHMGLTTSVLIGTKSGKPQNDCVALIQKMRDAAHIINPDVMVLSHVGLLAEPKDAQYILDKTGISGFFGASSMVRLHTEIAITNITEEFKSMKFSSQTGGKET